MNTLSPPLAHPRLMARSFSRVLSLVFVVLHAFFGIASGDDGCSQLKEVDQQGNQLTHQLSGNTYEQLKLRSDLRRVEAQLDLSSSTVKSSAGSYQCTTPRLPLRAASPFIAQFQANSEGFGRSVCQGGLDQLCERFSLSAEQCNQEQRYIDSMRTWSNSAMNEGDTATGLVTAWFGSQTRNWQTNRCISAMTDWYKGLYTVWTIEQKHAGREGELVGVCKEWLAEYTGLLAQSEKLNIQRADILRERAEKNREYKRIWDENRSKGLRCR